MKAIQVLAALPLALGIGFQVVGPAAKPSAPTHTTAGSLREFTVPIADLQRWSDRIVVQLTNVTILGSSKVHRQDADCEMHFGARSLDYRGSPDGLVLEPMNCCSIAFPGTKADPTPLGVEQSDKEWLRFAKKIRGKTVSAAGVPRIWPEHLVGGDEDSNPNHAIELHPLCGLRVGADEYDFSRLVSAGSYQGGVKEKTAAAILKKTQVSVTTVGELARISFLSGTIGNFTVLDITISTDSIVGDGHGSFRALGKAVLEDGEQVSVAIVTNAGSKVNDDLAMLRSSTLDEVPITSLVLFSLNPEALLRAASKSNGGPIAVERPIQLILYGSPE